MYQTCSLYVSLPHKKWVTILFWQVTFVKCAQFTLFILLVVSIMLWLNIHRAHIILHDGNLPQQTSETWPFVKIKNLNSFKSDRMIITLCPFLIIMMCFDHASQPICWYIIFILWGMWMFGYNTMVTSLKSQAFIFKANKSNCLSLLPPPICFINHLPDFHWLQINGSWL